MSELYSSIYKGSVFDNQDPSHRGRLRVVIPQILGTSPSGWAEPTLTTQDFANHPIGSPVWILFEGGDINYPTYIARFAVQTSDLSADVSGQFTDALAAADEALLAAQDAQATADGKVKTYFQNSAPTGLVAGDAGDLWFDTDDGYHLYRWSGSAWLDAQDTDISSLFSDLGSLTTLVGTKITTFYQGTVPTSTAIGDLWVDTAHGNVLYRAAAVGATTIGSGAWVSVRPVTITAASSAPSSPITGDFWIDTGNGNILKRWNGTAWVVTQDQGITDAYNAAAAALSEADTKVRIFFEAANLGGTAPTSNPTMHGTSDIGDLWYRTDQGNKLYRWDGTQWLAFTINTVSVGTDGAAPSSSPTPVVNGFIGSLGVTWTPVTNHDPVLYEVHISTTSGFTPSGGTTLVAITPASNITITKNPAGASLTYGATYYVKIIAKDADGSAAASTQASGVPAQITGPDIAVDAVSANQIDANAITAKHTLTGPVVQTAATGERLVLRNDGSGGVLETFAGLTSETAGYFNPYAFTDVGTGIQYGAISIAPSTTPSTYAPLMSVISSPNREGTITPARGGILQMGAYTLGIDGTNLSMTGVNSGAIKGAITLNADTTTVRGTGTTGGLFGNAGIIMDGVGTGSGMDSYTASCPTDTSVGGSTISFSSGGLTLSIFVPFAGAIHIVHLSADVAVDATTTNLVELLIDGSTTSFPPIATGWGSGGTAPTRVTGHRTFRVSGLSAGFHTFSAQTRNVAGSAAYIRYPIITIERKA